MGDASGGGCTKGEGLEGGGWGQDVTASFPHLSGNLRGIGVLRQTRLLSACRKKWIQLSAAACGGARWHSQESLAREPLVPGGCSCQHRRVFAPHATVMGNDSWQGLCSCWGDMGGLWELAILAADAGRVTPISTVGSRSLHPL